jgi:hypothetical protein
MVIISTRLGNGRHKSIVSPLDRHIPHDPADEKGMGAGRDEVHQQAVVTGFEALNLNLGI